MHKVRTLLNPKYYHAQRPHSITSHPRTPTVPSTSLSSAHSPLAGTARHHTAYVLLHTHCAPSHPVYPERSKSPLWHALTLRTREWGGVVNFAWSDAPPLAHAVHPAYTGLGEPGGAAREGGVPLLLRVLQQAVIHRRLVQQTM